MKDAKSAMPVPLAADELVAAINLLLHEVRSPLGVAQGYLRLILDGRLDDASGREQALAQSLQSLGRIATICASASELISDSSTVALSNYAAAELVNALSSEANAAGLTLMREGTTVSGSLRSSALPKTAAAIIPILKAVTRHGSGDAVRLTAGVHESALVITCGGPESRRQLLEARPGQALRPWGGGQGLLLPVALKHLRDMGAHVWTLTGDPSAVAIAFSLEPE